MSTVDPLESADTATLAPREYYGEVLIDSWFCGLVKGAGKVPYDPTQHKQRFTAIKIDIVPLADSGTTNPIGREMIAESKEWVSFTLASLKALGVKTADIRNKWAKVTFVETGESYKNAAGETKHKTALKFLAIYPDEAACKAAYETVNGAAPASTTEQQPQANGNGHPTADPETRAKLVPYVKVVIKKAVTEHPGDLVAVNDAVSVGIASHSTLKNFFTATDPDVMQLITDAVAA